MVTWAKKVAFVGLLVKPMSKSVEPYTTYVRVRLRHSPGGAWSRIGQGKTLDEAIGVAATSLRICWSSVERKITEREWNHIAHT